MRPWHNRSIELEATEGHYCDFVAFLEWFKAEEAKRFPVGTGDILGDVHGNDIDLYVILCDAFDAAGKEEKDHVWLPQ